MFHSLDVLRKEVNEKQYRTIIDTTFDYSHVLDMDSIADRGRPAPWLYDNINIVIVAGGEERVNGCHELMKELQALALDDMVAVLDKTSEQVNHNYYHVTKGIFRLESNEQFMRSMINACR